MENKDRISNLSDDLLHKIMSFMNTKSAVQTCILSKRWKSVWKSLPYLDFNMLTFPLVTEVKDKSDIKQHFWNFIREFLSHRQEYFHIVKLCVRFYSDTDFDSFLKDLIRYAVERNVEKLYVHSHPEYYYTNPIVLPNKLFTCQSLTKLVCQAVTSERSYSNTKLPKLLLLPALKFLHLYNLEMTGPNFDVSLFSGCPNLETLNLSSLLVLEEQNTVSVNSAPYLKNLVFLLRNFYPKTFKIVIDAPELTTLRGAGFLPAIYSKNDLTCLDDVCFSDSTYRIDHIEEEHALESMNTFKQVRHARCLTLSPVLIEVLAKFPSLLDANGVSFPNLSYLTVGYVPNEFQMPANVMNYFFNDSTTMVEIQKHRCHVRRVAARDTPPGITD